MSVYRVNPELLIITKIGFQVLVRSLKSTVSQTGEICKKILGFEDQKGCFAANVFPGSWHTGSLGKEREGPLWQGGRSALNGLRRTTCWGLI